MRCPKEFSDLINIKWHLALDDFLVKNLKEASLI